MSDKSQRIIDATRALHEAIFTVISEKDETTVREVCEALDGLTDTLHTDAIDGWYGRNRHSQYDMVGAVREIFGTYFPY